MTNLDALYVLALDMNKLLENIRNQDQDAYLDSLNEDLQKFIATLEDGIANRLLEDYKKEWKK